MKKIIAIFIFFVVVHFAFTAEFGGILGSNTSFAKAEQEDFTWTERADLALNAKIPFTASGNIYLAMEGVYRGIFSAEDIVHAVNLPLLKFNYSSYMANGFVDISVGRFFVSDITGKVLSQTSDGISAGYNTDSLVFSMYAGYTGLVNSKFVQMNAMESYDVKETPVYNLSLPYVLLGGTFTMPYLFMNQNISLDVWGAVGLQGLKRNNIYTSGAISGPIYKNLYYTLMGGASFVTENGGDFDIGGLAILKFDYFFNLLNMVVSIQGNMASENFQPITSTSCVGEYMMNNILSAGAFFSMHPLKNMLLSLRGDGIFQMGDMQYQGIQVAGEFKWQLFSDVLLGITASYFIPDMEKDSNMAISANVVVSF